MWSSVFRPALASAAAAACVLCAPVRGASADSAPAASDSGQSAVWTQKELSFVYQGFTTKYSCDGLRDKVREALLQLGARKKDLKVYEYGCSGPYGRPDPFPGVRIKMSVLAPASGSDASQTPVEAHWKAVDLRLRDASFRNESGECELVEQIRQKILPLFATRNVDSRTDCVPHQASPAGPTLKVEVLAVNQKDEKARAAADAK
ncbi:MAG TPA: hypothetical protein VLX90_16760 [Steroidobacteraceae bacterium]|nr:hypothetical protein [Steroidobacteraceae bacterium]